MKLAPQSTTWSHKKKKKSPSRYDAAAQLYVTFHFPSCTVPLSDPRSIHTLPKCPVPPGAQGAFQATEFTKASKMSLTPMETLLARTKATTFSKIHPPSEQRKETLELTFLEKILECSLKETGSERHVPGEG